MKTLFVVACLKSVLSISFAVNPACECVLYKGRDHSNQGTFTSPNHPQIYPVNVNCILYTFVAQPHQIVEIIFTDFDIQVPVTSKCSDFVRLFLDLERPEVNEQKQWNYELCGNSSLSSLMQRQFFSSTSNLILEFHADHVQTNNTGFRGVYKFIDRSQFETIGGGRRWGTSCTYDFYSSKESRRGAFFSPKYPQNYPPASRCQYTFYGQRGERVRIHFSVIQLEHIDGSCMSSPDYITVRDGLDTQSPVLHRFCNTRSSVDVESTGENLVIELIVDELKQSQGFAGSFAFISTILSPSGTNNDGPSHYPPLQLPLAPESNTHHPGDSPQNGGLIDVDHGSKKVTSDFEYYYRSNESKNGSFTSPGYPAPYAADITARYIFEGTRGERVQIIFNDLDLRYIADDSSMATDPDGCTEEVDFISVSVPLKDGPHVIRVICGTKRPPMLMSNGVVLDVTFISRSTSSARGFSATYKFVTDFGIKTGVQNRSMPCGFVYRSDVMSNGTFTSPNFPGFYPCNTECHYLFYGKENEKIHITFPYFDVDGIPPSCLESDRSDYVEFSNFNIDLVDRKMNRFCGSKSDNAPWTVNSDGPFFRVTFKSNDIFETTGFEAFYQFRRQEEMIKKRTTPTLSPSAASSRTTSRRTSLTLMTIMTSLVMTSSVLTDWHRLAIQILTWRHQVKLSRT